jgi:putative ABC transport system permease protein
MKIFSLSLKNLFVNWWRSLTLGTLILVGSTILVVMGCLSATVTSNMQDAIRNSISGDIQIRSIEAKETDMLDLKSNWSDIGIIDSQNAAEIEKIVREKIKVKELVQRVRQNVFFVSPEGRELSMLAGIDRDITSYKDAIELVEGKFLDLNSQNEIFLTGLMAERLNVKVGQSIEVISQSEMAKPLDKQLSIKMRVVGIGDIKLLSGFSVSVAYTNIEDARRLMGLINGEITDIEIITGDKNSSTRDADSIKTALEGLTGAEKYKITTWKSMGKFIMDGIMVNVIMFYVLIAILMFIICILIINLVYMIGLERRQQVGTLRAIGFSRGKIVMLFLVEIMSVSLTFCILGIAVGSLIVYILSVVGIEVGPPIDFILGKQFFIKYYFNQGVLVFGVIMSFSFIAALLPSIKAASIRPVDTLKET